jgi:hypothetical protein
MADEIVEATVVDEKLPAVVDSPMPGYFANMRPAERVAFAVECANALKPIIDAKGLAHRLNKQNPDDEYVELEGWQTCGSFCGMTAKVDWVRPVDDGFEARAVIVRIDSGLEVGAGISSCERDEWKWKNANRYALKGMAQTRAQSRAFRGVLAWILVLAGYKPTPSEEMTGVFEASPVTDVTTVTEIPKRAPRRRATAAEAPGEPPPAADHERERVYRKIFALINEYALLSESGKDLMAEFKDKDKRHNHAILQRMYGKRSLHQLSPDDLHDFISKLERRIAEAQVTP